MSIVAGNDFTGPFMYGAGYQRRLGIKGRINIENIAGWIQQYGRIENHPFLHREMVRQLSPT